jgi:hypothetical protein
VHGDWILDAIHCKLTGCMLRLYSMKKPLLIIAKSMVLMLFLLICAYFFSLAAHVGEYNRSDDQFLVAIHPLIVRDLLILAVPIFAVTVVIALFWSCSLEQHRLLVRGALFLLSGLGIFGVSQLYLWSFDQPLVTMEPSFLMPHTVYAGGDFFLRTGAIKANEVEGVWYRHTVHGQQIEFYPRANIVAGGYFLELPSTQSRIHLRDLVTAQKSSPYFNHGTFYLTFDRYLRVPAKSWFMGLLQAFALSLVLLSTWFWVRLSRWPLWNTFWALLWLVFIYYVLELGLSGFTQATVQSIAIDLPTFVLPALFGFLSLITLFASMLLPPFVAQVTGDKQ